MGKATDLILETRHCADALFDLLKIVVDSCEDGDAIRKAVKMLAVRHGVDSDSKW